MLIPALDSLLTQLTASQKRLATLLSSVARDQDWRPAHDQWSFRFIAAHLAVGERECLQERVKLFASGTHSHFDYYDNSNRDFSHLDLMDSLHEWERTRAEIFAFVRALPEDAPALSATAHHSSYGDITLLDYLRIWLQHDQEHLRDLEQMMKQHR